MCVSPCRFLCTIIFWVLLFLCCSRIIVACNNFDAEWRDILRNHVEKMVFVYIAWKKPTAQQHEFWSMGQNFLLSKTFVFLDNSNASNKTHEKNINKLESETKQKNKKKNANINKCHGRQRLVKSEIFFIQYTDCKFGWKYYVSSSCLKGYCFSSAGHTYTNQRTQNIIRDTSELFTKNAGAVVCVFCFCVWCESRIYDCVCVCAIVIRRRHHGRKHETERNKIILWHWLTELLWQRCYFTITPYRSKHTHTVNGRHLAQCQNRLHLNFQNEWVEREKKANIKYINK